MTERTSTFLMANLGSEVSRYLSYIEKKDSVQAQKCRERAEKIIAELKAQPDMSKRTAELVVLEKVLDDFSSDTRVYEVSPTTLRNYFLPFALRVMS